MKVSLARYVGFLLFCNYFVKFVDAFLLAIYNTEAAEQQSNRAMSTAIVNMPANPLIRPSLIKVPPLATSSTYHDSARLESEDKLDQRPSGKTKRQCVSCDLFPACKPSKKLPHTHRLCSFCQSSKCKEEFFQKCEEMKVYN